MNADQTTVMSRQNEIVSKAYRTTYDALCGYVAKRIGASADVEDIVQDTFESLLAPGRVLSEQTIRRFIYSVAHGLVVDWYRRHACSIRAQEYFFAHSPVSVEDADAKVQVSDVIRIEELALRSAGEKGRDIYMMFVHQGESVKEIALRLDLSERTVENHIFRTRTKVRAALRMAL